MEFKVLSSMSKVFFDECPNDDEITSISVLLKETAAFQLAVFADYEGDFYFTAKDVNDLCKPDIFLVKDVPVGKSCVDDADDYYCRKEPGMYPDVLVPVDGAVHLEQGRWYCFFIEFRYDRFVSPESRIEYSFGSNDSSLINGYVGVDIVNAELPEQELIYTSWFHCDGFSNYYNLTVFSEEFWTACENYARVAFENGQTMILTPLFTPPLDTQVGGERLTVQLVDVTVNDGVYSFGFDNLDRWVSMCNRIGFKYLEMSHFFTQWGAQHAPKIMATVDGGYKRIFGWETDSSGAEYTEFLRAFSSSLNVYIKSHGLTERCYFHISDEPGEEHLETYKRHAALIEELFPGFKIIDALSEFKFYESGAVKHPIPDLYHLEDFYGKVPELWTYYCCGHGRNYVTNRMIAMPGQRTRILGVQLYKYDCKGFLQWGYNFYNSQCSVSQINPYEVTDSGNAFPAGDAFVVYPAENFATPPYCSIRLKNFFYGLQDLRALKLLESFVGRDGVLRILEDKIEPISVNNYPRSIAYQIEMRNAVNDEIKKFI